MERIFIIKNFLGLVALTKKEKAALIRELVNEWHLSESEVVDAIRGNDESAGCSDSVPAVETKPEKLSRSDKPAEPPKIANDVSGKDDGSISGSPVIKKRGRRKKTETETAVEEPVSQVIGTPAPSKRGRKKKAEPHVVSEQQKRRRGRPKKVRDKDVLSAENQALRQDFSPGNLSAADAALIEEAEHLKNIRGLLDEEPEKCSKATRKRNPAFKYLADFPALKKFVIGQEYSFEFMYQWDDKKLLSSFVLADLMPIGIYIPYKNVVFGKYRGFIVSIYDEKVAQDIAGAKREAAAIPAINDENWGVMDSLQWSVLKTYINTVNRMLGKVGGDLLKTQYRTTSPNSDMVYGLGGFRYTVNVK